MIALLFTLLLALPQDPSLEDLAATGEWERLEQRAAERLAADPTDNAARAWVGRALLGRARELLAGEALARDLGRALLERAIDELDRAVAAGVQDGDATREWLLLALHDQARATPLLAAEPIGRLEAAAHAGEAYGAYLRGMLATEDDDPARALPWLRQAVELDPSRAAFSLALAEGLAVAGRRSEALEAWRQAAAAEDADAAALAEGLARLLPARADAAQRADLLEFLEERWRGDPLVSWHRAWTAMERGRSEEAAAAFAAGAAHGGWPEYDRAWAAVLRRLGRHQEAIALLLPLAQRRNWEAYADLLSVADDLAQERRWDAALAAYELALAVEDRDERARRNHALTLWRAGHTAAARQSWDAVLELFPERADILNDAALAAWGAGERARARLLLEQAIRLPGAVDARENLAALLVEQGEGQQALELLGPVLEVEPGRARALWLRARAGGGAGDTDMP